MFDFPCSSPFQLLIRSGRTPEQALMVLVPEAYKNHPTLTIKYPEVFFVGDLKFQLSCKLTRTIFLSEC